MAEQWFHAHNGKPVGPVSIEALRQLAHSGALAPIDLVWKEGMPAWVEARMIPELWPEATPPPPHIPQAPLNYYYPVGGAVVYAGFWRRFVAYVVDCIILYIPVLVINGAVQYVIRDPILSASRRGLLQVLPIAMTGSLPGLLINWLYYAGMESSQLQATLGKMALGIIVTDLEGRRLSFGRATGRYFAKWISTLILYIGFLMAGFTERKQALHDMIANCLVVKKQLPTAQA